MSSEARPNERRTENIPLIVTNVAGVNGERIHANQKVSWEVRQGMDAKNALSAVTRASWIAFARTPMATRPQLEGKRPAMFGASLKSPTAGRRLIEWTL